MGVRRVIFTVLGVVAFAYGALSGLVWLINTMQPPSAFIGQVELLGFPIVLEGSGLPWIAVLLLTFGSLAVWRANAE